MALEELNDILIYAVPNTWAKHAYLQGWNFEGRTYKDTYEMFEHIKIVEQVYEGGNTSKNTNQEESDRVSHGRKHKGGEAALPTNPEKGRSGKHKKKIQPI